MSVTPKDVTDLAEHLGCTQAQLQALSRDVIRAAFCELKMTSRQQAAIELWLDSLGAPSHDATLYNHFRAAEDRKVHPWKVDEVRATRTLNACHEERQRPETLKALQCDFVSQVKAGMLSHVQVVIGNYCLFSEDLNKGVFDLLAILLRVPPTDRLAGDSTVAPVCDERGERIGHRGPDMSNVSVP